MEPYKLIDSNVTYKGRIIDVRVDTISLPDGGQAKREVVMHNGAAAILPVDADGNIIFVRQYRHPAEKMTLEIPAGALERGEDPLVCAARELTEETGYIAERITLMTKMYPSPGFCNQVLYIYLAESLTESVQNLDEDEFIEIERYPLDDAIEMIFDGRIIDSETMIAVLGYKERFRS